LAEYKNQQGEAATKSLIDQVATVLIWTLLLTCGLAVLITPVIVLFIASGLKSDPATFDLTVTMTRVMFPYIGFMSFVALAGAVLSARRVFRFPAFTPVLRNLAFVAAALFLAPHLQQPICALAVAVLVGGVLQMAIQLPALYRIGMVPRIRLNFRPAFQDA